MAHDEDGSAPLDERESRVLPGSPEVERWGRVKEAFLAALEQPESERNAFLASLCADDPDVGDDVRSLLESDSAAGDFGETPAVDLLGQEAPPDPEPAVRLEPGTRLGAYEVKTFISAGGMGEVYRARHTVLHRQVAIKTLQAHAVDAPSKRRLLREARHASTLNHPNICKVYEVGEVDGTPFVAMEFVEGRPLQAILHESVPLLHEVLSWGIQIADALEHAHQHGIVHRDLKSSNVVVDPRSRPVVLDFGLARRTPQSPNDVPADSTLTTAGMLAGTLSHMAPEVLLGGPSDARSDIWSLGVLLYELTTGELPFRGRTPFETSFGILHDPPRPIAGRVPLAVRLVIERCLVRDPSARYQSAAEVRQALDAIRRRRTWPLVGRLILSARRRTLLGVAATVALTVPLLVAGNLLRERTGSLPGAGISTLVLLPLENATGDPGADYYAEGLTDALTGQLGAVADVRIISWGSAASVARAAPDRAEAARQLGVDAIIEGRLRQASDRIAVDVWLTESARGQVLWSDSYERGAGQVLALQADLVRGLAAAVRLAVREGAHDRLAAVRAVNPEAYQAYLKSRYEWNKRTTASLYLAIEYLNQAIELDPTYAPAYAALADCFNQLGTMMVGVGSPLEFRPQAATAAVQALQIDPFSAEAHAALGYVRHYDWMWEEAEREFLRAMELNPSYAPAHLWYANLLMSQGRLDEALEQVYAARDLEPFSLIVNTNVGWVLVSAGRHDEAIAHLRRTLELDSTYVHARWRLAYAMMGAGRVTEAYEQAQRVVTHSNRTPPALGLLANASGALGRTHEVQAILAELLERAEIEYVPPPTFVEVYLTLGDLDNALLWTFRAFEERANWVVYLDTDSTAGPLQRDPRFRALIAHAGLG